ncbi:N-methyl-L-tryptophan oxidase [Streptomyces huiliensis]|uniref:N-methyl-L-tryptophan oxidase n=1 Tax=Streptomyces huiliensis TaxID=2876027 RepID=UPI001CBDB5C6|nr:N-methyl-L-tryptophan oxidase [Streptomyces huiliensis]MBZ4323746.1 N-methyl-L-tryptophan oxidase [Streptomyces huiliensis]
MSVDRSHGPHRPDVVVVGLGIWGAMTLWRLAARGVRAVGVERFDIAHARGSSHGGHRMFRETCLENEALVPVARRSLDLWRELEAGTGRRLFENTGGLLIGPRDGRLAGGTIASAEAHGVEVEVLEPAEVSARFPGHAGIPDGHVGVWEPSAGVLRAEDSVRAAVELAERGGATVLRGTEVLGVEPEGGGVRVRTAGRDLLAGRVVLTPGCWLPDFTPGLGVRSVHLPMTWFPPSGDPALFRRELFPVFMREIDADTVIWGQGDGDLRHVKLGIEQGADPDPYDPELGVPAVPSRPWERLGEVLATAVPGVGRVPSRILHCGITTTADGQFVLGASPADPRVVLAGGCNGYGFKHAAAVGDLLADIVMGATGPAPLPFAAPGRLAVAGHI